MIDIVLDGEKLVIDWDAGFTEGRQYERINRSKRYKSKYRNTKNVIFKFQFIPRFLFYSGHFKHLKYIGNTYVRCV